MRLQVPLFSQRDPQWANKKLGFSSETIGGFGCLLSVMSMLSKYYGKDTDPGRLNDLLKNLKPSPGYADPNLYKWYDGVPKIWPDISCTAIIDTPSAVTAAQFKSMEDELNAGRPVVLEVDFIPSTSQEDMHFVLLIGKEDGNWIVADPWYGDVSNLTRYGDPKVTIQRYVFHNGPIPQNPSPTEPTIAVPVSERDWLVSRATTAKDVATYLELSDPDHTPTQSYISAIGGYKSRITDLTKQLSDAIAEKQNREEQVGRLKEQVLQEQELRKGLNDSLNQAIKKLSETQGVYEGQLAQKQGVIDGLAKDKGTLNTTISNLTAENQRLKSSTNLTASDLFSLLINKIFKKG